ncbi:MAG: EF-hand domain-containing protein [Allosphingosinicella sp.]
MFIRTLPMALVFLAAGTPALAQALTFDLNKDGKIDRREFVKGREARFTALDHNKDHVISSADFAPGSHPQPLARRVERMIGAADLNRDGKVTLGELQLSGSPVFEEADTDMNGVIEGSEIARFKAELARPH